MINQLICTYNGTRMWPINIYIFYQCKQVYLFKWSYELKNLLHVYFHFWFILLWSCFNSCSCWVASSNVEMVRLFGLTFRSRERAASLSRLSDSSPTPPNHSRAGLARTLSFREQARSQCTFRACDLVKGELLGKGFFGQVKMTTHLPNSPWLTLLIGIFALWKRLLHDVMDIFIAGL